MKDKLIAQQLCQRMKVLSQEMEERTEVSSLAEVRKSMCEEKNISHSSEERRPL